MYVQHVLSQSWFILVRMLILFSVRISLIFRKFPIFESQQDILYFSSKIEKQELHWKDEQEK